MKEKDQEWTLRTPVPPIGNGRQNNRLSCNILDTLYTFLVAETGLGVSLHEGPLVHHTGHIQGCPLHPRLRPSPLPSPLYVLEDPVFGSRWVEE